MSGELTPPPGGAATMAEAGVVAGNPADGAGRRSAHDATAARVVAVFVLAGALAGWLWETLWTPPTGFASGGAFYLDGPGLRADFSGTGLFVLVGLGVGVMLGAGCAFIRHDARVVFAAVLIGSVVAALACAWVGHWLGPADPVALAATLPDRTPMVADLHVVGDAPYLAWPVGAICGFLLALLRPGGPDGTEHE